MWTSLNHTSFKHIDVFYTNGLDREFLQVEIVMLKGEQLGYEKLNFG